MSSISSEMVATELGFEVEASIEARGIYTAERLRSRKPEIALAVEKMLRACVSTKMISELLSVDIRTVAAMADDLQASGSITPYKERTLAQLRSVITLGLDSLVDRAKAGKVTPIELCALIDKHELLSGGATARVEIVNAGQDDDFLRMVRSERQALGMVIEGRESLQNGRAAELPAPRAEMAVLDGSRDSESRADGSQVVELERVDDSATDSYTFEMGGGGVPGARGGTR